MKKVLFTAFLITLSPMAGKYVKDISACYADEKDNYKSCAGNGIFNVFISSGDRILRIFNFERDVNTEALGVNPNLLEIPQSYELKQHVYHFNSSLGLYGGYRIYLDPINE